MRPKLAQRRVRMRSARAPIGARVLLALWPEPGAESPKLLLLAFLLALGCSSGTPTPAPGPTSVEPRGGETTTATPVTIHGEHFFAQARQSLAGGEPALDEGFRAWLGGVELREVRRLDATRLAAVVPQGLPAGLHALELRGPHGTGRLEDAYEATDLAPATLQLQLEMPAEAPVGMVLQARLTVANTGGRVAEALRVRPPTLSGNLGIVAAPAPPSALAAGESVTLEWQLRVLAVGSSTASWEAEANDGVSLTRVAAQASAQVICRAQGLAGELLGAPPEVSVGQEFEVRVRMTCFGSEDCHAVGVSAARSGTATVEPLQAPPALELAANTSTEVAFRFRATAAGALLLRLEATGTFGTASEPVLMLPLDASIPVRSPAALTATASATPAAPREGAEVVVELLVRNDGEAAAALASLSLQVSGTAVLSQLAAPSTDLPIAGGAQQRFLWRLAAQQAGDAAFGLAVSGTDALSGSPVAANAAASLTVRKPAALAATWQLPAAVGVGLPFETRLLVANVGGTEARDVTVGALAMAGTSSAVVKSGPSPLPTTIPAGGSRSFLWNLEAGAVHGTLLFSTDVSAVDAQDGLPALAGPLASPTLAVQRPAGLRASFAPAGSGTCDVPMTVTLTVENVGDAAATSVAPTLALGGTAAATVTDGPVPASAAIAGGASQAFVWTVRPSEPGTASYEASVTGQDVLTAAALNATATVSSAVRRRATLQAEWLVPATVTTGQAFDAVLSVRNVGTTEALGVDPAVPSVSGTASGSVGTRVPGTPQIIPAGETRSFTWSSLAGATPGTLVLTAGAQGTDAIDAATVTLAPASGPAVTVQAPAGLEASLGAGSRLVYAGERFTVTLVVSNPGGATARGVVPALEPDLPTAVTLLSGPEPATADVPAGSPVTFTWTWESGTGTSVLFTGSAAGTDANLGTPVEAAERTLSVRVAETEAVASDPFLDGSSFSFVFAHGGQLFLGPNKTGSGAVRMNPDGTGAQSVSFAISKDVSGSTSASNAPGPFASFGAPGCTPNNNTANGCGPDNEDGRGLFASGTLAGQPWLFAAGARSAGRLTYVYLTPDTGPALAFRYVDLSNGQMLGPQTKGISSAHFFRDRLYLGFADGSNNQPFLLALMRGPNAPGLDATPITDALSLEPGNMPGVGDSPGPMAMVDSIADFADRLYLFNDGGCTRSTKNQPDRYSAAQGDWTGCTPTAPAYTAKVSLPLTQNPVPADAAANLDPGRKAFPQIAVWRGRLYAARNTTAGPQLWSCAPGTVTGPAPASATDCDPGDWSLVAPNETGDTQLTQFDDTANAKITLLVATADHLFVGYDNAAGITVFRTSSPTPTSQSDFLGAAGCSAASHPSCTGIGGVGLGSPLNTRIFHAAALDFLGEGYVYLTTGNGTGAVKVVRLPK